MTTLNNVQITFLMPNFSQILMLQIAFLFSSLLLQSGFDAAAAEKNGRKGLLADLAASGCPKNGLKRL